MDSQMLKELAKLVVREDEANRTRESGFAETSHEVTRSSIRSWRNSPHVSADEGCFTDDYGNGAILRSAVSAGGTNLSRTVPDRAAVAESLAVYQAFIQQCWAGLVHLRRLTGMLDKDASSANLVDEINLENYVTASKAEYLRLKKLNLKSIQPLLSNWSSLLALVHHGIKQERECFVSVRRLHQTMSLVVLGLFAELQDKDLIQQNQYVFSVRESGKVWNRLLN